MEDTFSIDMNVMCAGSGEKEKIKIIFGKSEKYDPNYESDLMTYIKNSGLLEPDDIKLSDSWIITKGSMVIDEPANRDHTYKRCYIMKRDENTINSLIDGTEI